MKSNPVASNGKCTCCMHTLFAWHCGSTEGPAFLSRWAMVGTRLTSGCWLCNNGLWPVTCREGGAPLLPLRQRNFHAAKRIDLAPELSCKVETRHPEVYASSVSTSSVGMIRPAADHGMAFAGSASEQLPSPDYRNSKMQRQPAQRNNEEMQHTSQGLAARNNPCKPTWLHSTLTRASNQAEHCCHSSLLLTLTWNHQLSLNPSPKRTHTNFRLAPTGAHISGAHKHDPKPLCSVPKTNIIRSAQHEVLAASNLRHTEPRGHAGMSKTEGPGTVSET